MTLLTIDKVQNTKSSHLGLDPTGLTATSAASAPTATSATFVAPAAVAVAATAATAATAAPVPLAELTEMQASRFLAQASMGASRAEIARVKAQGLSGWIDGQLAMPQSQSRWDWLVSKRAVASKGKRGYLFDSCNWKKFIFSPDTLRQRMTMVLSEILVVNVDQFSAGGWKVFTGASYLDLLEANAFGNYRELLGKISVSTAMGSYLTFKGNVKYNPVTGAMPDENYAREIMQLFSIGLVQLNLDGSPQLLNGKEVETYTMDDVTGLARVFTGWDYDMKNLNNRDKPDYIRRPMAQRSDRHETGASTFLNRTIPSGLNGQASLNMALDVLFAHQNVAPFISKQLIQKLVTSNPSPSYIRRVATVFNNDGKGVKGNLAAVIKAILLDNEARDDSQAMSATNTTFGKQREPILRFVAWSRAYSASSTNDTWAINKTSSPGTELAQSPLHSPSVFNFYRPGYVPPNSAIANARLVAPEFQLTNETTVAGYINYMQAAVSNGVGDVKPDYTSLLPKADDVQALLSEINLVLAAGQIANSTMILIKNAVGSMPSGTKAARYNRIYASLTLVLAAPEFIVLK
ncbi:MAG: hypothetical protein ACI802_002091 [Candidatus Paceibacteria bacterium]|jgi:uncharacterized protein (DUF1800 family)